MGRKGENYMNKRQRKKKLKKRYGYNPPRSMPIHKAEQIAKTKEQCKKVWEFFQNTLQQIVNVLRQDFEKVYQTILQQQDKKQKISKEAEKNESDFNSETENQ